MLRTSKMRYYKIVAKGSEKMAELVIVRHGQSQANRDRSEEHTSELQSQR